MNKKYKLSWEETIKDISFLIEKVKQNLNSVYAQKENIKVIVPCRWWEIIGSLLKNSLGLDESNILRVKFSNKLYSSGEPEVVIKNKDDKKKFEEYILNSKKYISIFLDDLVDSGLTIDYIKSRVQGYLITGVLYSKEGGHEEKVNYCVRQLPKEWVVFPWEDFYDKNI